MHSYVGSDVHTNSLENFWSLLKRGVKGGWDHGSRRQLIIDLLGIIEQFGVVMFGVGLQTTDYAALDRIDGDIAHSDYHLLMQGVIFNISEQLEIEKLLRRESVVYFF